MKGLRKLTLLSVAVIMILQIFLPTISYAVDEIKLNIQNERPYSDDNGDGTVGNDIYTLIRSAEQTVFKIGEQDSEGKLSFDVAYYCLRGGLGFGSTEEILPKGVNYTKLADLKNSEEIKKYYKDTIGYDISDENYNAICWIADNMYLPKSQYKDELKTKLLKNAGITDSKLTDDDIEVVQQVVLWYFSNYDQNGDSKSVSLPDSADLGYAVLKINGENASNDESKAFNKIRAGQINTLYNYFKDHAKDVQTEPVAPVIELDKNIKPTIEEKTIVKSNTFIVGPFKIEEKQKADNVDVKFTYKLSYKQSTTQTDWTEIEINNQMGTVYLSDAEGNALDRTKTVADMIGKGEFYITILKDVEDIETLTNFKLDIGYTYSYFKTTSSVWVAGAKDQPVLKVEKEKIEDTKSDSVTVEVEEQKAFDLSLRKFIISTNGKDIPTDSSRVPLIYLKGLREKTSTTAEYKHPKNPIYLKRGDKIVYTIRIYNEGEVDGYATEVTDYLCDGLELVENSTINAKYGWTMDSQGRLKTTYLKDTLIKAYNPDMTESGAERAGDAWQKAADGTDGLYYADLLIECRIKDDANVGVTLPNVAAITGDLSAGDDTPDRDSHPEDLKDDEIRNYENNPWYEDDDDYERVEVTPDKLFDLSLRKYITKVNDTEVENTRIPNIDVTGLDAKTSTTADYKHRKDPVEIKTGDLVTYNITVYNEGEVEGRATKIVDQLPTGLKLKEVIKGAYELDDYNEETNTVTLKETDKNQNLKVRDEGRTPDSVTVTLICEVTAKVKEKDQVLTNVAWISEDYNAEDNKITDRDSKPSTHPDVNKDNMEDYTGKNNKSDLSDKDNYYKGQEDDDDFEKLILKGKEFDLSLRKYISNIERKGGKVEIESRVPSVDTTPLKEGKTTAKYTHSKQPITVKQGDLVTFKLRVYNEGQLDGYVTEIVDYLPEGLGLLVGYSGNDNWLIKSEEVDSKPLVGEKGWYKTEKDVPTTGILKDEDLSKITIVTGKANSKLEIRDFTSLKEALIKKYGAEVKDEDLWQQSTNDQDDGLFYQEVEVTCIVTAPNTWKDTLYNIAEISGDRAMDDFGTEVDIDDRDSKPDDVDLGNYEYREDNSTYQEDDDDYEPLQLKYFDLALRKFITGVNDKNVDTRIPEFYIDENGEYKYRHDKTPVEVTDKDNVTYTIRVFNEGTIAGYAEEIEDDIPAGLIFLPENETNKEYEWKMYFRDENGELVETDDVQKATIIRTKYLSEAKGTVNEETGKNSNLLEAFDKDNMKSPDYRDVKVVFKVSQKDIPEDNDDRIVINKAQITEDSDDDEDSTPDKWNEGEDDQDREYIKVKIFDLALFKWVSQTVVTVDGKTTTTETGFKPNTGKTAQSGENYRNNDEKEPIASVVIDKKKLKSTVVKFVYNIKVVNEGEIAGYATELTDYIPEGLKFDAEDNPLWSLAEDGKITTRALETVLLEPGQSATVPVTFTWINGADNLGVKTNIAAITEDYNDKGIEDIDSTPGNEDIPKYEGEQEDDDDFALVILTLKTGSEKTYIALILTIVTIISLGALGIKKYVL